MRDGATVARRSSVLPRPRLLDLLRGVESNGLAVIVAPVGFGKTTLLGQWCAGRSEVVRWCDHAALPTPEALLHEAKRPGALGGVIIDDLREPDGPESAGQLERLIQQIAPIVPVVLATRRLPAFNLARHEFPRPVIVTARDLAFRSWEIAALFAEVHDDPLGAAEPFEIAARTGGWPAALRLWHLARCLGDKADSSVQPAAFDDLVDSYLRQQVLGALGGGTRRQLRVSSVFDAVTAHRLDVLTDKTTSHRQLARIVRRVDLVGAPTGSSEGPRYSYHVVLRRHLRSELERDLGTVAVRRLYQRAADIAETLGDHTEAFAARCRAQDGAGVAALLTQHRATPASTLHLGRELLCSGPNRDEPILGLARARLLLADGRREAAHREATRVAGSLTGEDRAAAEDVAQLAAAQAAPIALVDGSPAASALRLLAHGDSRAARAVLSRASDTDAAEWSLRLAAELALTALDVLIDRDAPLHRLERIGDEIRAHGETWLGRLAHAVALCRTAKPARCAEARSLAAARDRVGDGWGAALIESAVAIALFRRGHPDVELLDRLCGRFRLLGAPVLEAWARSALALAVTEGDFPDSEAVTSAVACARTVASPGSLALAYAALAEQAGAAGAAGDEARAQEVLALAQVTARSAGLVCRPWTWHRDASAGPTSGSRSPTGAARRTSPAPQPRVRSLDRSDAAARGGGGVSGVGGAGTSNAVADGARGTPGWGGLGLTCFGSFAVTTHDGEPAPAGMRPVALTVLRILAVHAGCPVHRDVLVEAQWSHLPESAAQHNLHVAISTVRQRLESVVPGRSRELLARQGQAYVLATGSEAVTDLQRFDARLADSKRCRRAGDRTDEIDALRSALDLYVGEVLPGDGTAEWVVPVRERYRLAAAAAAARIAELELSRDRTDAAVAAAVRSLQIDPFRDASWRTLVAAHVRAGEPAEAERAKREYAAVLASLGVSTMPHGLSSLPDLPSPSNRPGSAGAGRPTAAPASARAGISRIRTA